ncbi:copper-transporting P-type ATPase [Roseovarius sp. A-2]|uniref:heavy metal translocating P-type ATPase n=1 Tax=Roseovarius sp. A-2 TaxID=1570360 RepID=UPI0009B50A1D|nr:heavy metal translocating P-type ATPase [Roseovarius sp. A-2]GAW35316.1 copper-transporting P-type ATPase [Roseovarius sp. A-2]
MTAETTLRIEVQGMNCAACAGRAERALGALPGLHDVSVNFASGQARMVVQGTQASDVAEALKAVNYPAREATVTLSVSSMSCASCINRVEAALKALPAVIEARANLATETAQVRFLPGGTDALDLARRLSEAGYPARVKDEEGEDQAARRAAEVDEARRKVWIAGLLTLPVFALEMGSHVIPGLNGLIAGTIGMGTSWLVQFVLTTAVLIWPGRKFYRLGVPALLKGAPDMNSLVALGASAAWAYSTVALFASGLLPEGTRAVYFEAAAVIVTLILTGRWLEARAKGRTGAAIQRLIGLQPRTARVERNGEIRELAVEEVAVGDLLHLRPGEQVAIDGEVTEGNSYIDESMITGEPAPEAKGPGDTVVGGTINGDGALSFRATAVGRDTVLARIVAMVEEAQGAKLPVQALADRVVRVFVPIVIAVALVSVAVWLMVGPAPALPHALIAGVSVLIIACPCAMGLATPTSIMVGTGRAAEIGVLFRKGEALQRLDEARVVAFDKTGTLTQGKPAVTQITVSDNWDEATVLRIAAAAQGKSEHPIARAMEDAATRQELALPKVQSFNAIAGHGIEAEVDGYKLLIGAARLMTREGIEIGRFESAAQDLADKGQTAIHVAIDGEYAAILGIADAAKPSSRAVIEALHARGLRTAMITGDSCAAAQAIADELGIDHVEAEVLPEGKVDALRGLQNRFGATAFVGDGINDAPALAQADIGIAVGTGTDVAIESADVVLMSGDLAGVVNALDLSHRTLRNIRQNLFWAFAYNTALIPVAAGLLYPVTGLMLSPMLAAGAMALSSVFVLSNALRLRGLRPVMEGHA